MLQKDISDSCRNRLNNSITTINLYRKLQCKNQKQEPDGGTKLVWETVAGGHCKARSYEKQHEVATEQRPKKWHGIECVGFNLKHTNQGLPFQSHSGNYHANFQDIIFA